LQAIDLVQDFYWHGSWNGNEVHPDFLPERTGSMNSEQIKLVQSTFESVRPIAATAAELFYGRLFELDPSLRPLFKGDIVHQGRMLMSMLSAAVSQLTRLDGLVPIVRKLGARHVAYGVRDHHYATVGAALLWTLEQGLGEKFTLHVREAWTAAYTLLAGQMQIGALEVTLEETAEPA
jgi:hemoglobin-like flavoprotein